MNILCKSLKLGGNNYHFKWVKVPGTTPLLKGLNVVPHTDQMIFIYR
jgi:hypothetical protein